MGVIVVCLQPKENSGSGKEAWQILVVDDEPAVCGAIKMMLEYDGHNVRTASNGMEV